MEKMTCSGKEFDVIKLLGKGKGGYSYLVTDSDKEYVLKQIHHEPCSYYPTNFVVRDGVLYYIDFECNDYMEQWDFEHWGNQYWWKSPEFLKAFEK